MGQEGSQPSKAGSSGGANRGGGGGGSGPHGTDAQYAAERAKMVHVTTDVSSDIPEYELEANRLMSELAALKPVPPLIKCTEDATAMNKTERINTEVLRVQGALSSVKIPHDRSLKVMATYQTCIMREASQATARMDDTLKKMQNTAYLTSQLKTVAWNRTHDCAVFNHTLMEAEHLSFDVTKLASEAHEICSLLGDIRELMTEEQRAEIRTAIEEENEKAVKEDASHYHTSPVGPPSTKSEGSNS